MLLENSGKITPERIKMLNQSENNAQLRDVTGDGNKLQCLFGGYSKEQYCLGTCNVRSIKQGKLARLNIHILRIHELEYTGMGEFNSDDHYIYYCG